MGILKSLIESGDVKRYLDFRTGSISDFSSFSAATSIYGVPKWRNGRQGIGLTSTSSGIYVSIDPTGLQPPSSGMLMLCLMEGFKAVPNDSAYFTRGVGTNRLQVYFNNTTSNILAYNGGAVGSMGSADSSVCWKQGLRTLGCVLGGGVPRWYRDGSYIKGYTALTYTGDPADLEVAVLTPGNTSMQAYVFVDKAAVTDADIARLHRELTEGPGVVRRSRKHFSIPYPSKTPAEYAAEGIILDMKPVVSGGQVPNHAGTPGNMVGGADGGPASDGPFSEVLRFSDNGGYVTGTAVMGAPTKLTISTWIRRTGIGYDLLHLGNSLLRTSNSSNQFYPNVLGAGARHAPSIAQHRWTKLDIVAKDGSDPVFYVDSIPIPLNPGANGPLNIGANPTYEVGRYSASSTLDCDVASMEVRPSALTPAQVRADYLKGARKCLLDARVHSDGSCPVSLASVGAPNEIANGWEVESGTWKVVEDAPAGGVPGKRWLSRQTGAPAIVSMPSESAYGSWYWKTVSPATNAKVGFASSMPDLSDDSYYVQELSGSSALRLSKTVGGAVTVLSSVGVILTGETEFWAERRFDGLITVWAKGGGVYTTWTLILQATDTTITSSKYAWIADESAAKYAGIVHYLG